MGKKQKTTDWTLQHHDGVSEKCMIARPARPPMKIDREPEVPTPEHILEVRAWVDDKMVGHVMDRKESPMAVVALLRGLADSIESGVPAGVPAGDIL